MKIIPSLLLLFAYNSFASSIKDYDGRATNLSWIYSSTINPVNLTIKYDEDKKSEKIIGQKGGVITLNSSDGTLYTLDLPENAVLEDTKIQMSELIDIQNMPLGKNPIGVHLLPNGLKLNKTAILTIKTPNPIPIENQIPYTFDKNGNDLIFAPPVVNSKEIQIQVTHFSGYGITKGYLSDYKKERELLGGSVERKLYSTIAEKLGKEKAKAVMGTETEDNSEVYPDIDMAIKEYFLKVVLPRAEVFKKSDMSCAEGRLARETLLDLARKVDLLGFPEYKSEVESFIDFIKIDHQCMKEEYELCKEKHIYHQILPQYLSNTRMRAFTDNQDEAEDEYELELVRKCLKFDIEFNTKSQYTKPDPTYYYVVNGTTHLGLTSWENGNVKIGSEEPGSVQITYFDSKTSNPKCSITTNIGGPGMFHVNELLFDTTFTPSTNNFELNDLTMFYFAGGTTETITLTCPRSEPIISGQNTWTVIYTNTHADEFVRPTREHPERSGLAFSNWKLYKDRELIAEKSWDNTARTGATDVGNVKLFHRPE